MTTSVAVTQPNAPYTPLQRTLARSLIHAFGTVASAERHLHTLWEGPDAEPGAPQRVPSAAVLSKWRDDATIPLDDELVAQFQLAARNFVVGSALRIAQEAEAAVLEALSGGESDALAASRFMQVWSAATDKLQPREAGNMPFGPMPRGMGPGQKFTAMTTFTIEEPPARETQNLVAERAE